MMRPCSPLPNPREMNLRAGRGFEARYQAYLAVRQSFCHAELTSTPWLGLDHRVRNNIHPDVGNCACRPCNHGNASKRDAATPCA